MKLLKVIGKKPRGSSWKTREASRAVLFDKSGRIPLLFVAKYGYHKLPGGGIEKGEDKVQALMREVREETGGSIEVTGELGKIIEFRPKYRMRQVSYCYLGKIIAQGAQSFTKKEKEQGFSLMWLPLDKAISVLERESTQNYEGNFIRQRDLLFLRMAKRLMGKALLKE